MDVALSPVEIDDFEELALFTSSTPARSAADKARLDQSRRLAAAE